MKKLFLLLSVLVMQAAIASTPLNETQKLEATARIWGFLKYYHPQVAKGKFNWDDQLISILPQVDKARTKEELSTIYLKWIETLGDVPACNKCSELKEETFDKNFSMAWMENTDIFTPKLTKKLKYIEANRHLGEGYYAGIGDAENLAAKNEQDYKNMGFGYPEKNYRLLCLFRYWNIVEYFFPCKYMTDQKWDDVLTEMIPRFSNVDAAKPYQLLMLELVGKINDSHGYFYTENTNEYFGFYWAPVEFLIIDGKAVVNKFRDDEKAKKDDLRVGDVITHVNGVAVTDILAEKSRYITASNAAAKKRDAYYAVLNGSTNKVTITFERDGKITTKDIARYPGKEFKAPEKAPAEKYKVLDGNIGYVNMGILEIEEVDSMMKKLMDCKVIIFDIRNYPHGTLFAIGEWLLPEPRKFVLFTKPDFNYPGKYTWITNYRIGPEEKNDKGYKGKVMLLVNETTQSHAEFTAMSLQAGDNVTTIGSQTAGADGDVSVFTLPGGYETAMIGIGVFYPDGTEAQRKGVKIDIHVEPSVAGIRTGKDEVLEKAIELAKK